jgi:hypothetical protein
VTISCKRAQAVIGRDLATGLPMHRVGRLKEALEHALRGNASVGVGDCGQPASCSSSDITTATLGQAALPVVDPVDAAAAIHGVQPGQCRG